MLHASVKPLEARRERFDRRLMHELFERRVPVFGIGTGLQLMNVVCGGNLLLHLQRICPASCHIATCRILTIAIRWSSSLTR